MIEAPNDLHPLRLHGCVELISQRLDNDLIEGTRLAPLAQPQFERLRLDNELAGRVFKLKATEVGLARDWAEARELGAVELVRRLMP